ncbi:MAG: hypothetical protein E6J90_15760 [Deltaproteobacteria bacterium]|nr:MAG: hypothetical protein E6J90_15760 [Deltaproteobacteria bacterium]
MIEGLKVCAMLVVPTELKTSHQNDYNAAFRDALCGDWYTSHKEAVEASGGADIPIKVFKIGIHGEYSKEDESVSRTQYCRDTHWTVTTSSSDLFFTRFLDEKIAEKVNGCMQAVYANNPRPLQVTATTIPEGIRVSVRNVAPANGDQRLAAVHAVGLACDKVKPTTIIAATNEGLTFNCRWSRVDSTFGEVSVVAGATAQTTSSITAVAYRELPPLATVSLIRTMPLKVTDSVAKDRCSAWVSSPNLHGKDCDDSECKQPGLPRECTADSKRHCKLRFTMGPIERTGSDSTFGNIKVDCPGGGCEWSAPSQSFRSWEVGGKLFASASLGSIPSNMRFCADETLYRTDAKAETIAQWKLVSKGSAFILSVPKQPEYSARVLWGPGSGMSGEQGIPLGKDSAEIKLVNAIPLANTTEYTYRLMLH